MVTIKDVALLAGVSVGTVSNVINGRRVNEDCRVKVEKAIKELNFIPQAAASNLKSKQSNTIAVVLPDIYDSYVTEFLIQIEKLIRDYSYSISLHITDSTPALESKAIREIVRQKCDAAIIYAANSIDSTDMERLLSAGIKIISLENDVFQGATDFFGLDNSDATAEAIEYLLSLEHKNIAMLANSTSFDGKTLVDVYKQTLHKHDIPFDPRMVIPLEMNKESGFKGAVDLLQQVEPPTAFLVGGMSAAEGVIEAVNLLGLRIPEDISLICVSESTWLRYSDRLLSSIERPVEKLARSIMERIIKGKSMPQMSSADRFYIQSTFVKRNSCAKAKAPTPQNRSEGEPSLKLLMMDAPATYALKKLLPNYSGKVEIELLGYQELYEEISRQAKENSGEFDIYMTDISWITEFAKSGTLSELSDTIDHSFFETDNYIDGIMASYFSMDKKIYGLPFMPGTQILFYRKDLFEDRQIRAEYLNQFGIELVPPTNWTEFNHIASFFTREFNPNSATLYGTTMAAKLPENVANEFMPRQWAYGSRVFDEKQKVVFDSYNTINALQNFAKSYQYAPPHALSNNWDAEITDFCAGNSAMLVHYESHSTRINQEFGSRTKGSVGYGIIPGESPLLGGWSLAVNRNSGQYEQAINFLKWSCGSAIAVPYAILGGTTAWKSSYQSSGLNRIYPWLSTAYKSYALARERSSPYNGGPVVDRQRTYDTILGEEVRKFILKECTVQSCIENVSRRMEAAQFSFIK